MNRHVRRLWRPALGAAVLAVVLWQTGAGPFVDGVRSLDATTLVLGALLTLGLTLAGAWRWRVVADGLGVGLGMGTAVASCYRAQFLNVTLPGGVLGDVHRGVRHGLDAGSTSRGLRSVLWERVAGQVVQAVIALAVLLVLPSPVQAWMPVVLVATATAVAVCFACAPALRRRAGRRFGALRRAVREDVRNGVLRHGAWQVVLLASTLAVAGHVATYFVAARAVGVSASTLTLLPLVMLVLVAAALPVNLAGWGPREGMAAWVFGAAGLGVDQGVAAATAYGAIVLVASLPGLVVLLVAGTRRAPRPAAAVAVAGAPGVGGGADG
ncbi:MAG TPA: lysylphosphatidylglycerol synthase transmembrane domain-containing protein [Marmoricola sp.]|nr:lysylphosphatidylglycerol synthase transmembrane domain-containing protein [Marmoricola sp.]